MKIELAVAAIAIALAGCTGTNRGKTVPASSEGTLPAQEHAYSVTIDSPATNASRNAEIQDVIKVGDTLLITFTNLPSLRSFRTFEGVRSFQAEQEPIPAFDQRVKGDGTISLIYNSVFHAAGKRTGDLEKEILDFYVPGHFPKVTVTVRISCWTEYVYVDGCVRNPGRYPWTNGMRLKDAIEAAGGFTEYATHLTRLIHLDGTVEKYRLRGKWPVTNNPALKPGDRVHSSNPRDLLW
jgi:protein involved in polysaccharide export with SLBB domain